MKTKTLLIAAAMLLCMTAASYAQSIYATSSTPITTVIASGNAELAGNITFTASGANSVAGTISIQYGGNNVNITSNFDPAKVNAVAVTTVGGGGSSAVVDLTASQFSPGLLVVDVPAGLVPPYTITVSNVRVQINGTGLTSLIANISATGNLIAAGSTSLTVINSTTGVGIASATSYTKVPPISDLSKNAGSASINGVTAVITPATADNYTGNTSIVIKEGFLAAFTKGVGARITVSAIPPKGIKFAFPGTATSYASDGTSINPNWVRGDSTVGTATGTYTISSSSTNSGDLQVYYYVNTDTNADPVNIEYLEIPVTVTSDNGRVPYSATQFTYTVSLAPVANPYNRDGVPGTLPAPRFAALETAAATLTTITGSSTTLLIPYGYASTTAGDFNTAMAIANTTEDPGTTILGFTGATKNGGAVTFYLFPINATLPMFTYKTVAGSPGSGLDASGLIPAGGTYSVFLSQIFPLATPADGSTSTIGNVFQGYVMIQTGFTNAHGIFVISNFTTLTAQSSLMSVLGINGSRQGFPEVVTF